LIFKNLFALLYYLDADGTEPALERAFKIFMGAIKKPAMPWQGMKKSQAMLALME